MQEFFEFLGAPAWVYSLSSRKKKEKRKKVESPRRVLRFKLTLVQSFIQLSENKYGKDLSREMDITSIY